MTIPRIQSISVFTPPPSSPRRTRFSALADAVKLLTVPGKAVAVHPGERVKDVHRYIANLTAAIQGRGIKAPKGFAFRKQWDQQTNRVVIYLVQRKAKETNKESKR